MRNYGYHFSKKAFDFAVSMMRRKNPQSGKLEKITPWTKEEVYALLGRNSVTIENDVLYDAAFVANMAKSDFFGTSLMDEASLAKYVRDYVDDPDAKDGFIFVRWYATMCNAGIGIEWSDML